MKREFDTAGEEELFDLDELYDDAPKGSGRIDHEKKSGEKLFAEVKIRMVMRIRGVSRMRAMAIIEASKAARLKEAEKGASGGDRQKRLRLDEEAILAAEELFN